MRNRVTSTAIGLLALSLSATAADREWYAAIDTGAAWNDFQATTVVAAPLCGPLGLGACGPETSADMGWTVHAALGTSVAEHVRIEGELGYADADFGGASITHTTLMANALYDIPLNSKLALSIGAGLGMDSVSTDDWAGMPAGMSTSETSFAYQGIVGLAYDISEKMDLTLTYRHMETTGGDGIGVLVNGAPSAFGVRADDPSTDSVSVGLRFKL